ncbi:MAG TPA: alpha/beta fold hydrolase [Smithellaceae bacterium]|nr:alpha/beta fold hydrolase [Smithellaceae bacterium]
MLMEMPANIRKQYPFQSNYIKVNGRTMHYLDEGDGEPILLLHGNPTWTFLYRKFIPILKAEGYRILSPDLIGLGMSEKPSNEYSYSLLHHTSNLEQFIVKLNLKNINLVIQDWAGPIGLGYAVRRRENVKSQLIMSTWAWTDVSPFHDSIFPWRMMHAPLVGPYFLQRRNALTERGLRLSVVNRERMTEDVLDGYRFPMQTYDDRATFLRFPRMIPLGENNKDNTASHTISRLNAQLPSLNIPTLIIWGEQDDVFPKEWAQRFYEILPNARPPIYVQAKHFIQEDEPEFISRELLRFLKSLSRG